MREYFRPYTKIVDLDDTVESSAITLTDTSGGLLDCNYISVIAISGTDSPVGYFLVTPSGINTLYGPAFGGDGVDSLPGRNLGPSAYPDASSMISNGASGVLGLVGTLPTGSVVISLASSETSRAIILSQAENIGLMRYAVTYGQVTIGNLVLDNRLDRKEYTWT